VLFLPSCCMWISESQQSIDRLVPQGCRFSARQPLVALRLKATSKNGKKIIYGSSRLHAPEWLHMWNVSCAKVEGRMPMERYEFIQCVAHELLHFKSPVLTSPIRQPPPQQVRNVALHEGGNAAVTVAPRTEQKLHYHQSPTGMDVIPDND
jgi:hypothetical protein